MDGDGDGSVEMIWRMGNLDDSATSCGSSEGGSLESLRSRVALRGVLYPFKSFLDYFFWVEDSSSSAFSIEIDRFMDGSLLLYEMRA
jgi:hypothetical protein